MTLEEQLERLSHLGLELNDGVSVEDLLESFDRESYERAPFDCVLFVLGSEAEREPWGRPICSRVWDFDCECIENPGDYVRIVDRLCEVAGMPGLCSEVEDSIDFDSNEAWLKYTIDGKQRYWNVEVDSDWADPVTVSRVMTDIERDGYRFFCKDNGQAMVLFYLDAVAASELNELSRNSLRPALPKWHESLRNLFRLPLDFHR
ncbi:MAG: hypothetical protein DWQ34_28750 [Planctomycetota bacterium]|nr:MAG: hypothetical protein DWQ29_17465 [Planctomycetota bacterium]REJ85598.1 MAG: hypothetical protein DWQ34_28750 [Planctomycetota bacterium]REK26061.1 MAG: hypothetical protein DWQ41_10405 [Planctomycetota bacterium]REK27049.1 MAG: hypothetical protein DWQ45_26320 [Planctomycetota bacterium]